MSRTQRIYHSYRKYGRFFPKRNYQFDDNGIYSGKKPIPYPIKSLKDERFDKYRLWCMGNCHYCHRINQYNRNKQKKSNLKRLVIKFFYAKMPNSLVSI